MDINIIKKLNTVQALKYVLNDIIMEDFQVIDCLTAVTAERSLLGQDTGLGNTIIASGIMKMLHNENPNRKFIFVCKTHQFIQTPKKIADATGLTVIDISSKQLDIDLKLKTGDFLKYDVLILAEEVFDNPVVNEILLAARRYYCGIFVDEIHTMCNYNESCRAHIIRCMMKYFKFAYGMSATPMTSNLDQYSRILNMLEPETFPKYSSTTKDLRSGLLNIESKYPGLYIRRTRRDLGIPNNYRNHIHLVDAMPHQIGADGRDLFETCKGEGADNQVNELIKILKSARGKGIVYIRHHSVREFVSKRLNLAGIHHECIHGKTSRDERRRIMNSYNNNEINLVITSITSSIDLDGDYLVLYEYTCELRQILGRLERGLIPKMVDIHYIFTDNTGEVRYFIDKIYQRSLILQTVLRRDYSMILQIYRRLAEKGVYDARHQC